MRMPESQPRDGVLRVNRGGGWINYDPAGVRASRRDRNAVTSRNLDVGFRCARHALAPRPAGYAQTP